MAVSVVAESRCDGQLALAACTGIAAAGRGLTGTVPGAAVILDRLAAAALGAAGLFLFNRNSGCRRRCVSARAHLGRTIDHRLFRRGFGDLAGFFFSLAARFGAVAVAAFLGLALLFGAQTVLRGLFLLLVFSARGLFALAALKHLLAGFQFGHRDAQLRRERDELCFHRFRGRG